MSLFNVYPLQPIAITKAQGSLVWDDKGQEYLDMYGGHAVISIGHTHPHWVSRIEDQLHKIAFYSNSVVLPIQNELADKLNQVSGKKNFQLFLCNSGAEANENALKLAENYRRYWSNQMGLTYSKAPPPIITAHIDENLKKHIAGFFDGDGSVGFTKTSKNKIRARKFNFRKKTK